MMSPAAAAVWMEARYVPNPEQDPQQALETARHAKASSEAVRPIADRTAQRLLDQLASDQFIEQLGQALIEAVRR